LTEFRAWEESHPTALQTHSESFLHYEMIISYITARFEEDRVRTKTPSANTCISWISIRWS
jgi:hypothetical protein